MSNPSLLPLKDGEDLFFKKLLIWYQKHQRPFPWRYVYRAFDQNPPKEDAWIYKTWISEVMLQQTGTRSVVAYFERFVKRFPDLKTLAESSLNDVLAHWQGLGYYRRALFLHQAAKWCQERGGNQEKKVFAKPGACEKFNGKSLSESFVPQSVFPSTYEGWRALPGVGPYTADAIWSIAYNQSAPAVDGNIRRIMARQGGFQEQDWKKKSEQLAKHIIEASKQPAPFWAYNQALMDLGALVCRPSSPKCQECPVSFSCKFYANGALESWPPKKKQQRQHRYSAVLIGLSPRKNPSCEWTTHPESWKGWPSPVIKALSGYQIYIQQNEGIEGEKNFLLPGLWKFPMTSWAFQPLTSFPCPLVGKFSHAFTHFQGHVSVLMKVVKNPKDEDFLEMMKMDWQSCQKESGQWIPIENLFQYGFSTLMKKAMERIPLDQRLSFFLDTM